LLWFDQLLSLPFCTYLQTTALVSNVKICDLVSLKDICCVLYKKESN